LEALLRLLYLTALAACGRYGFAPPGQPSDAARDAVDVADVTLGDVVGDVPRDASGLGPCVPLAISDNFDDGTPAAIWMVLANNPVTTAETGGELQVTLASAGGSHYGGYDSLSMFDLRDHCIYVTYVTVPTNEPLVEMTLAGRTSTTAVGFVYHAGVMDPFVNTGTFTSLGAVTYNPAVHKVMRVREDSGTMTWETSADGITFQVMASEPTPVDVSSMLIVIEAGTYGSAPSPGMGVYDNFDFP
jgi:hypothetical protein